MATQYLRFICDYVYTSQCSSLLLIFPCFHRDHFLSVKEYSLVCVCWKQIFSVFGVWKYYKFTLTFEECFWWLLWDARFQLFSFSALKIGFHVFGLLLYPMEISGQSYFWCEGDVFPLVPWKFFSLSLVFIALLLLYCICLEFLSLSLWLYVLSQF